MKEIPELEKTSIPGEKRWYLTNAGGLIAISVVILQAFLSASRLDGSARISVSALAIAIPMLVGCTILLTFTNIVSNWRTKFLMNIGTSTALIGMAAAIFHVSRVACVLFVTSALVAFIVVASVVASRGTKISRT